MKSAVLIWTHETRINLSFHSWTSKVLQTCSVITVWKKITMMGEPTIIRTIPGPQILIRGMLHWELNLDKVNNRMNFQLPRFIRWTMVKAKKLLIKMQTTDRQICLNFIIKRTSSSKRLVGEVVMTTRKWVIIFISPKRGWEPSFNQGNRQWANRLQNLKMKVGQDRDHHSLQILQPFLLGQKVGSMSFTQVSM